jgi:hypothetical protein
MEPTFNLRVVPAIICLCLSLSSASAQTGAEQTQLIRENFLRINANTEWSSIDTLELWESAEGGDAVFFYESDTLAKIRARYAGETWQGFEEYYFLAGQLSFVYEKDVRYNRPLLWDSIAMQENGDNQVFDFDKSRVTEVRSYFSKGSLFKQLHSENGEIALSPKQIVTESARLMQAYQSLLDQRKK